MAATRTDVKGNSMSICKCALEDLNYLLMEGFDSNIVDCEIDGVKDTISDLVNLVVHSPDGKQWMRQTFPDYPLETSHPVHSEI